LIGLTTVNRPGESGDFLVWGLSRRLVSGVERSCWGALRFRRGVGKCVRRLGWRGV